MRKWLKEIFREVIKEEIHDVPLIVSCRAPSENDVHQKGTTWLHGNEKYIAAKVTCEWERI